MTEIDPLTALVVDGQALARDELATALTPYIQLTPDRELWPLEPFEELSSLNKVLCLLLAVKAQEMLGFRESGFVTPADLVNLSGMPPGTIRPKLSELAKARFVTQEDGRYTLSPPGARHAMQQLGGR